jgi:serine protease
VTATGPCYRSIDTTFNTGLTVPAVNAYSDQTNPNLGTSFSAPIVAGIAALMRAVNANLTPPQLIARIEASASPFPPNTGTLPVCPATDPSSQECSCVAGQCGAGMVNALSAVNAALDPIAAIASVSNTVFDASGSVAACNVGVTPNVPLSVASYMWTASGGVTIQSGAATAQVTVASTGSAGTLMLTVTDSAGHMDTTANVSFTAGGVATVNAPSSPGTAATACPMALTVTPAAPTVTETFSPTSVGESVASTLTITFNNSNHFDLTQSAFTETMPGNLNVQTMPAPTTTCTGASATVTSSTSSVTLNNANIPASGSCSMTMTVKSANAGTYTSAIAANALSTGPTGSNSAAASASLTVTGPKGGGAVDWLDVMFVVGVLLAGRRHVGRRSLR